MHKITITNLEDVSTSSASFSTEAELQAWKAYHESIGTFRFTDIEVPAQTDLSGEVVLEAYTLPKTHNFVIADISAELAAEAATQAKIDAGKTAREVCTKVLDLVAGFNLDRELTLEQITELQQTFEQAERALRAGRPTLAKLAISAIEPDGVLVSEELKSAALELLAGY